MIKHQHATPARARLSRTHKACRASTKNHQVKFMHVGGIAEMYRGISRRIEWQETNAPKKTHPELAERKNLPR